jgi:hypothetical protein
MFFVYKQKDRNMIIENKKRGLPLRTLRPLRLGSLFYP